MTLTYRPWESPDTRSVVDLIVGIQHIGGNQVALRKMFVAPAFRGAGHGVAARLLSTAITWAQEHGVTDVFLGTTDRFHAAHRFYEKQGFTEIAKALLPPSFPVMAVDSRFYQRRLEPRD